MDSLSCHSIFRQDVSPEELERLIFDFFRSPSSSMDNLILGHLLSFYDCYLSAQELETGFDVFSRVDEFSKAFLSNFKED